MANELDLPTDKKPAEVRVETATNRLEDSNEKNKMDLSVEIISSVSKPLPSEERQESEVQGKFSTDQADSISDHGSSQEDSEEEDSDADPYEGQTAFTLYWKDKVKVQID